MTWLAGALEHWLVGRGWSAGSAAYVRWQMDAAAEQVLAVVPITVQLVLTIAIFFGRQANAPGELTYGLICAIFGLTLFTDALRIAVMPLGEMLGRNLPKRTPMIVTLFISLLLGILCTYAEPAIASLRPLARLVDRNQTPYLHLVLNDYQELLIFSIGLGVGAAAVLGTLRFVYDWPLKPLIVGCMVPTVACACYMHWGNHELRPLIGLAWDCGGVTTGPVSVPVLLALGIGVMKTSKEKKKAQLLLKQAVAGGGQQPALEGFGIVTLASLLPILAVEILSIILSFQYSHADVIAKPPPSVDSDSPAEISPLREVVFAIRAILPLNVAMVLLVLFVLRQPLPTMSVYPQDLLVVKPVVIEPASPTSGASGAQQAAEEGAAGGPSYKRFRRPSVLTIATELPAGYNLTDIDTPHTTMASNAAPVHTDSTAATTATDGDHFHGKPHHTVPSIVLHRPHAEEQAEVTDTPYTPGDAVKKEGKMTVRQPVSVSTAAVAPSAAAPSLDSPQNDMAAGAQGTGTGLNMQNITALIVGVLMGQVGMILFNIGLTYGFTAIGDQVGQLLPASYLKTDNEPNSPYYSFSGGVALTIITVFILGFLATRAEPALNVMGKTVEQLSGGSFRRSLLVYSVCVGVGAGMAAGATKILFGVPVIAFILAKYSVALILTYEASEELTAVAWDSAGVTTGPVTVPFVLSTGIGFCKAANAPEGFGILTCASVAPIITVLLVNVLRRVVGKAKEAAAQRTALTPRSKVQPVQHLQDGAVHAAGTAAQGSSAEAAAASAGEPAAPVVAPAAVSA